MDGIAYIGDDLGADPPTPAEPGWLEAADASFESGFATRLKAECRMDEIDSP